MDTKNKASIAQVLGTIDHDIVEMVLRGESTHDRDLEHLTTIAGDCRTQAAALLGKHALEMNDRDLEDQGAALAGLPTFKEILEKYEELRTIRDRIIHSIAVRTEQIFALQSGEMPDEPVRPSIAAKEEVLTPPDPLATKIEPGNGTGIMKEFSERLSTLLCILYDLGIDPNDPAQVQINIGPMYSNMVRDLSYTSVCIPALNRVVELCNEVGNRSFVWDSTKRPEPLSDQASFYSTMTKEEKKKHIARNTGSGTDIEMRQEWEKPMRALLSSNLPGGRLAKDILDREELAEEIRKILEKEGVVRIEEREKEDGGEERVLVWVKTVNPNKKYGNYASLLNTLMGHVMGVNGVLKYQSWASTVPVIRHLYRGKIDREEMGNPDIRFELADMESKKQLLRDLLEEEGVIRIDERDKEGGGKERVLVWVKTTDPNRRYGNHAARLGILMGRVMGVSGMLKYRSWASIVPVIRHLYVGKVDREEMDNADINFEIADMETKKKLLQDLLEEEGAVRIEEREKEDGGKERVLVWLKTIGPEKKYGNYVLPLNTLMGHVMGVNGALKYKSWASIVPVIRHLYTGRIDNEEMGNPNIRFKLADMESKKQLLRDLLEEEGAVRIEEREKEDGGKERVLIWVKTINPQYKYLNLTSCLNILMGRVMGVSGMLKYRSWASIVPVIRHLYVGKVDREEMDNPDINFELADMETKKKLLRNLLEEEGVVRIDERDKEGGGKERVLVWVKTINPKHKGGEYTTQLGTLLVQVTEKNEKKRYMSFASIVPIINEIYASRYDKQEGLDSLMSS